MGASGLLMGEGITGCQTKQKNWEVQNERKTDVSTL